ncbi:MAG: hypothetical protein LQ350_002841 [Teloschistes chrysophthalmus]|nr:MAG: hypothetical protein LQ350_002841 [Niorma chrysophthalma]
MSSKPVVPSASPLKSNPRTTPPTALNPQQPPRVRTTRLILPRDLNIPMYLLCACLTLYAYTSTALFIANYPYASLGINQTAFKVFQWVLYAAFHVGLVLVMPVATCWLLEHHPWIWMMWAARAGTGEGLGVMVDCEKEMGGKESEGTLNKGVFSRLRNTYDVTMSVPVGGRGSLDVKKTLAHTIIAATTDRTAQIEVDIQTPFIFPYRVAQAYSSKPTDSEIMATLDFYMKKVYDHQPKYPSQLPQGRFFPDTLESPLLVRGSANHIILYNGAFNPPHQGHLELLRHTFEHGVPDLNVVAAIIRPLPDDYSLEKGQQAGGSFVFDRDTRCMLWKQDQRFPDWAWVHEGDGSFSSLLARLQEVASADGYDIDYLPLKGPWENEHKAPWMQDRYCYGATMLLVSDAARAADYQRPSGKIRDFKGYSKWENLFKLNARMAEEAANKDEWSTQGNVGSDSDSRSELSVVPATHENVPASHEDMKKIIQCRRSDPGNGKYQIRFVKTRENQDVKRSTDTSSTELRDIMSRMGRPMDMRTALKDLVLSGELLWECREQWLLKANFGTNGLISLQLPDGWKPRRKLTMEDLFPLDTAKTGMPKDEDAITAGKDQDLEEEDGEPSKKRKRASALPVIEMGALSPSKRAKMMGGGGESYGVVREDGVVVEGPGKIMLLEDGTRKIVLPEKGAPVDR